MSLLVGLWRVCGEPSVTIVRIRSLNPNYNCRELISSRQSLICKCVSVGYTAAMKTKNAGLRVRVERELRESFLEACRLQDRPAAQVIRHFMRDYVRRHSSGIDAGPAAARGEQPQRARNRFER